MVRPHMLPKDENNHLSRVVLE